MIKSFALLELPKGKHFEQSQTNQTWFLFWYSSLCTISIRLASQYQLLDTKPQNTKKRSTREIDAIIALSENDPRRMEGIRKFSAIYGRFDCKRRPEKPLTLHEVCVNEAAAQMCRFIPALLTRRVELFPLARQVVKDAGFGHSAGIARISMR